MGPTLLQDTDETKLLKDLLTAINGLRLSTADASHMTIRLTRWIVALTVGIAMLIGLLAYDACGHVLHVK